jgi:hypothetical protein
MAKPASILMGTEVDLLGSILNAFLAQELGSSAIKSASPPTAINATENSDQLPREAGSKPRSATYIRLNRREISPHAANERRNGKPISLLAMREF